MATTVLLSATPSRAAEFFLTIRSHAGVLYEQPLHCVSRHDLWGELIAVSRGLHLSDPQIKFVVTDASGNITILTGLRSLQGLTRHAA